MRAPLEKDMRSYEQIITMFKPHRYCCLSATSHRHERPDVPNLWRGYALEMTACLTTPTQSSRAVHAKLAMPGQNTVVICHASLRAKRLIIHRRQYAL